MLQILLYGPIETNWLEVDANTSLSMESLSELFDEDLTTGEFSLPVTLQWTEANRRILGFAERLENFVYAKKQWRCDVYEDGFPAMVNAQLTLLEKSGTFSYTRGTFNVSIAGTKGLFGTLIKNKNMKALALGGKITWADVQSRQFATGVMKGSYPQYPYLKFAPVAIEEFFVTSRPDFTLEFLAKDTVNNVIVTGSSTDSWVFGRPKPSDPGTPTDTFETGNSDYRTIPFFTLKYVLRQVFIENGFNVSGAIVDDNNFNEAVIFNNYSIEDYNLGLAPDFNRSITPGNHMPDMLVKDFLANIFSAFNVYPSFVNGNEVVLRYRKRSIADRQVVNLSEVCSNAFTNTLTTDTQSGYQLNYRWDGNDQYYSDRVKDLSDKTLVASVATFSQLGTLDIGRDLTTNDIAYVQADNMYYVVANATTDPMLWDAYAEHLEEYTVGDGERSVEIGLSTLATYVEFNSDDALYERRNYVGTRQPGTYINYRGTLVKNGFDLRLFFIRLQTVGPVQYPVSSNYNRDAANTIVAPYSLSFFGPDGLSDLHAAWQVIKQNIEIVKTTITANQKVVNDVSSSNSVQLGNVLYLPYKIERSIPLRNNLTISLVPL